MRAVISTRTWVLHPDLDRVLALVARSAPGTADRAGRLLGRLLRDVHESPCPEHAWRASALTGDGYPVELTFTSADDHLRYTVAPWPDTPAGERLARAVALVDELGGGGLGGGLPSTTLAALRRGQDGGPLDYGAWIGARHADGSGAADRVKLYAEVGERARLTPVPSTRGEGPSLRLPDRPVERVLHGYEPATGRHEAYFRVRRMLPHHLRLLLAEVGMVERSEELLDLLRREYGRPLDPSIPGSEVGFSLSRTGRDAPVVTVYLYARALWGGDRRIRRGLLRLADQRGWVLGLYEEVSSPLVDYDTYATHHGLVGFVVAPDRPVQVAVGLRPPPPSLPSRPPRWW